jgi:glycosyltransferase involved in cell wall biosynthesis
MFNEIFFSIIIPTRDRSSTLSYTILSILNQNYNNFELIISDNYSTDETKKIVDEFTDTRIRYLNTGKRVSMSENWEFAITNCTGDWITILGDDDALLPNALNKVNDLIQTYPKIEAIRSDTCYYYYPGVNSQQFGRLGIPLSKNFEIRQTQKWLRKVLFGRHNYTELPVLYNGGFISNKLIKKSTIKSNKFIHSSIPDVYSAMIFSQLIKEYIYSYEPFAINGASLKSNGISQFSKDSKNQNSPINQFLKENTITFNNNIPLYSDGRYPQSIKAFIYESYLNCTQILDIKSIINPYKQLLTILIHDYKKDAYFQEWARQFSKKHNLNFKQILFVSRIKKIIGSPKRILHRISSFGKYFEIGDQALPIINIYDAFIYYKFASHLYFSNYKNLIKFCIRKSII